MNYLSVESLSKAYGAKVLFDNISFGINKGQKMALVAKNGAGKTTLLNILMGKDTPDKGSVTSRKGITISYLPQQPQFNEAHTVTEALFSTDNILLNAVREYELALELFGENQSDAISTRLEKASAAMDELKAWDYEVKIKQILFQLKITNLHQLVSSLSGGQKKRLALSKILINEPDLVILDEPTNHLDIEMIEWLEEYLLAKAMTMLLVTHDRYFLDRVCDQIIELDRGKLIPYNGNFSYYIEKKAEREAIENSEIDKAKNLYTRELEWVRKMPKARGTKAKYRVDAFEDVKEKAFSKQKEEKIELNVQMSRIGGKILEVIRLNKSFGAMPILNNFSYVFKKNEKIGIVGKNGVGKTTFLNMLLGKEPYDGGKVSTGETIVFGYYSQEGMTLNDDKRVIEVIKDIAEFIPMANGSKMSASQLLLRFQFSSDMQYTYVSKLSGGERRRLYLLTVLMKNPNFLILDEPTNDLDILTLGILEEFLQNFGGCVLVVTHDRYFMDKLVDHIFAFEGDGVIKDFPGNYTDYRAKFDELEAKKKKETANEKIVAVAAAAVPAAGTPVKKQLSYKEKFEYETLEKEIAVLEAKKVKLTEQLSEGISDHTELQKASAEMETTIKELELKTERWLELAEMM